MATVEKMTIAFTQSQGDTIRGAVESGEFASHSEVVREAMREWQERRELFGYTLTELRALVQEGIDSGPPVDGAEAFARIREKVQARIAGGA